MIETKKLQPFFNELIIGILFVFVGFSILGQHNKSFLGFLGLLAIFWGGFKIFIGLIIYAIFFYSLFFKPEHLSSYNEKKQIQKIKLKIKKDLDNRKIDKALHRLHFLTQKFPKIDHFKYELATLYLEINKPINAGKQLFFLSCNSENQKNAVNQFRKSIGNSEYQILRLFFTNYGLDTELIRKHKKSLIQLIENINNDSEKKSWLVKKIILQIDLVNISFVKFLKNNQSVVLNFIIIWFLLLILLLN